MILSDLDGLSNIFNDTKHQAQKQHTVQFRQIGLLVLTNECAPASTRLTTAIKIDKTSRNSDASCILHTST